MSDKLDVRLRRIVVTEIGEHAARREQEGLPPLDYLDRRHLARSVLRRELDDQWRGAQQRGEMTMTPEEEDRLTDAILGSVFSQLPGLDTYLARDEVTDIFAVGCDNVRIRTIDGHEHVVDPIAASDEDLILQVQALARKGGRLGLDDDGTHIEKEFSPARPLLDLQLSDGSRLAAAAWVSARPVVTVRRHPLVDADQSVLVQDWKMYDEGIASLLQAAMRARLNILIAGGMGRGKTTLMRALLHECPVDERIVVLEQEPELQIGADANRHSHVVEFVERPSNMEGQGAITLADLTHAVKRHAPDRIVVGEVRGPEVMFMLEAACDGIAGTLCTLHAQSSRQTFEKVVNYARRDGAAFDRSRRAADRGVRPRPHRLPRPDARQAPGRLRGHPGRRLRRRRPADHHQRLVHPRARQGGDPQPALPDPRRDARPPDRARLRPRAARGGLVTLYAALAGLVAAAGLVLAFSGLRKQEPPAPARAAGRPMPWHRWQVPAPERVALIAAATLVTLVVVRWPVAVVGVAIAVTYATRPHARHDDDAAKADALTAWVEMLRDATGTPRGIEGVLTVTADGAPMLIRPHVVRLSKRLAYEPLDDTLDDLADDLDHPVGDLVVTSLRLAARSGGRQIRSVLDDLATAARAGGGHAPPGRGGPRAAPLRHAVGRVRDGGVRGGADPGRRRVPRALRHGGRPGRPRGRGRHVGGRRGGDDPPRPDAARSTAT